MRLHGLRFAVTFGCDYAVTFKRYVGCGLRTGFCRCYTVGCCTPARVLPPRFRIVTVSRCLPDSRVVRRFALLLVVAFDLRYAHDVAFSRLVLVHLFVVCARVHTVLGCVLRWLRFVAIL